MKISKPVNEALREWGKAAYTFVVEADEGFATRCYLYHVDTDKMGQLQLIQAVLEQVQAAVGALEIHRKKTCGGVT